ncbi:hypothetical protein LOK49_LG03G00882 [Camellia lanceoleosa]|uniref:Uncharacterized protein n=1 Tax=Camellia lanceoleosa TaxID=1840588 RepID=A0ACC0IE03_9ERIC|nr:hypothetical protein LOK49_LG03G00882 [Camellia lanceoleosa]
MASLSYLACYATRCSSNTGDYHDPMKQKLSKINTNGISSLSTAKFGAHTNGVVSTTVVAPGAANGCIPREQIRQNIPTKKQFEDPYRQGLMVEEGVGYRQTVVIRSYEVGPDKTATMETILNLLQETALNHVWMSGLLGDGFGATHGMMRNNLIWVVSRMQVETIPDQFLENHQLSGMILEYRRECGSSDTVQSLCEPQEDGILKNGTKQDTSMSLQNGFSMASGILEGNGLLGCFDKVPFRYTHLLQIKGEAKNEEIVRGRTSWKRNLSIMPFSI